MSELPYYVIVSLPGHGVLYGDISPISGQNRTYRMLICDIGHTRLEYHTICPYKVHIGHFDIPLYRTYGHILDCDVGHTGDISDLSHYSDMGRMSDFGSWYMVICPECTPPCPVGGVYMPLYGHMSGLSCTSKYPYMGICPFYIHIVGRHMGQIGLLPWPARQFGHMAHLYHLSTMMIYGDATQMSVSHRA